jgi:concentrative nucleoside transporter, CNT family
MDILRGLLGLVSLVAIAWLLSADRKAISWSLVWKGLLLQLILGFLILKVPGVDYVFDWMARGFVKVISFTDFGGDFLLGSFANEGQVHPALLSFAFRVLPKIIFFSALTALLYYAGILQYFVMAFAWLMKRTLKLSGAESLGAAGNVFLGQTEAPLLVRPYLDGMTKSEMMCLMTGGMATIAGSVLASFIDILGGDNPVEKALFAKHLLTASIMSAPAAIVAAKIIIPERETFSEEMTISKEKMGSNVLEAISNGTTDGLKLAINVGAMLLVFTAMIYMGNWILSDLIGRPTGLNEWIAAHTPYDKFSFQFLFGYLFAPIAWLIGVPAADAVVVGQLLGEKTILNEFFAYVTLGGMKESASIGIQIGGIGSLIPGRKGLLSKLGLRALIAGTLACLFTAATVGMMV